MLSPNQVGEHDARSISHMLGEATQFRRDETIGRALDRAATTWPDQLAIVVCEQGVRLTCVELRDRANALARSLIALGLQPGDRIGIWSPNNLEWVLAQFAAAKPGLILVSLNPAYRSAEVLYALRKVSCRAGGGDRVCIPVPFYHCFGMVMGNLACITHGSTIVVPGSSFEVKAVHSAIESEECTALYGVPTMFIAILEHPEFDRFRIGTLRTGIMAGAPCPIEVMQRVVDGLGIREITIAYGITERVQSASKPVEARRCSGAYRPSAAFTRT